MGLGDFSEGVAGNGKVIFFTSLFMFIVVVLSAIIVFFVALKPADQVMMPNVVGKELNVALLELQAKELNSRIQLRYSDNPDDEGLVLEQKPAPGAIVKAGRKIHLVISNGAVMNKIENYIGKNVDEVKQDLQVLFTSGSKYLVVVHEPYMYKFNSAPAGTILEQDPKPDSELRGRTVLKFVVSKGPENEVVAVPDLINANLNKLYDSMGKTNLIFDFTMEKSATIDEASVSYQANEAGASLKAYTKFPVKIVVPEKPKGSLVYGIYAIDLPAYPYPLDLSIDAVGVNGERTQLMSCKHPGGRFTFPYGVQKGTILVLNVLHKEVQTTEVGE